MSLCVCACLCMYAGILCLFTCIYSVNVYFCNREAVQWHIKNQRNSGMCFGLCVIVGNPQICSKLFEWPRCYCLFCRCNTCWQDLHETFVCCNTLIKRLCRGFWAFMLEYPQWLQILFCICTWPCGLPLSHFSLLLGQHQKTCLQKCPSFS